MSYNLWWYDKCVIKTQCCLRLFTESVFKNMRRRARNRAGEKQRGDAFMGCALLRGMSQISKQQSWSQLFFKKRNINASDIRPVAFVNTRPWLLIGSLLRWTHSRWAVLMRDKLKRNNTQVWRLKHPFSACVRRKTIEKQHCGMPGYACNGLCADIVVTKKGSQTEAKKRYSFIE